MLSKSTAAFERNLRLNVKLDNEILDLLLSAEGVEGDELEEILDKIELLQEKQEKLNERFKLEN